MNDIRSATVGQVKGRQPTHIGAKGETGRAAIAGENERQVPSDQVWGAWVRHS